VKIIIHGPLSGRDHTGQMVGWAPDSEVTVDDNDPVAVAWAKGWADTPHATLVTDVAAKPEPPAKEPAKEPSATPVTKTGTGRQSK
jgi:hypothetical protein